MALERELAEKNRLEKDVERWKGTDGKELERLRNEMAALEKVKEESILDLRRLERRCVFCPLILLTLALLNSIARLNDGTEHTSSFRKHACSLLIS